MIQKINKLIEQVDNLKGSGTTVSFLRVPYGLAIRTAWHVDYEIRQYQEIISEKKLSRLTNTDISMLFDHILEVIKDDPI